MQNYEERGIFQTEYCKQLVSFAGMIYEGRSGKKNVTPTDIDGAIQLDKEDCYILFELKHSGGMPAGQTGVYKSMTDDLSKAREAVFFLAVHNTPYPDTIQAKNAKVVRIYYRGKWHKGNGDTLGRSIEKYIEYVRSKK